MKLPGLLLALTASLALAAPSDPPNVVLVMADDQGWGDMAYNGHPHLKTPNFDAMAREGIRFDQFHAAAPVCSPTRGSVMTGRTPNRFGCFSWGHTLRPQEVTIGEVMQKAGYRTGHFGKWHLGSVQKASPVCPGASGFDAWVSAPNFFDLDPILSDQGKAVQFKGDSSDITADLALKFIRQCAEKDQRFLAVVWFGSPHSPHKALDADRDLHADQPKNVRDFYGEITAMDRAFGRIREELKKLDLRDETVLWYCSDNGALPKIGSSGGRRGNKGKIYEGGLLVPSLLEWPAQFKTPKVITTPCVTSDILPTIADITGAAIGHDMPLDGQSLLPVLEGDSNKRSKPIGFWDANKGGISTPSDKWMADLLADQAKGIEPNDPARVVPDAAKIGPPVSLTSFPGHAAWIDGSWKLHRIEKKGAAEVEWELYDLSKDPNEEDILIAEQPERFAAMRNALEDWLESVAKSLNGEDYKKP